MRGRVWGLLVGLACVAGVRAEPWQVQAIDGKALTPEAHADRIDPRTMAEWKREAAATAQRLGLKSSGGKASAGLRHPLMQSPGLPSRTRIGISNFVDLDQAFPNRLRDYECGARTYDNASGYNHQGIDYFLWPFAWQSMAQESVAVTAAAAGTIVQRADDNVDRSCSFNAPTPPNRVLVAHDDGSLGIYLHFKRGGLTPKGVGARVETGEFLGWIGSSGISTAPHLHFELSNGTGSGSRTLDPNQGQCNTTPSRWAQQPAYREPRLEMVGVHSAPPEFYFDSCSDNELPHFKRHFQAGDPFFIAAYYADQPVSRSSDVVLRGPDGTELTRRSHSPTTADFGNRDVANASYWTFGFAVPGGAPPGLYSAEVSYEGVTRRQSFAVGGPIYAASGVWYDPTKSGHGFTLEVVDVGGRAHLVVVWFVYIDGEARWLTGLGEIVDNAATVPVQISRDGQFPPAFDPARVQFDEWGVLGFTFDNESAARVTWSSTQPGIDDGQLALTRLIKIADINLDSENSGLRACASGTWYVPSQGGHGVQLQVTDVGGQRLLVATWYVYHEGKQVWLSGVGPIQGKRAVVAWNRTRGGQFPPAFDPATVVSEPWGTGTFEFVDPHQLRLDWQSSQPGFGSGSLELTRLTELLTASCQ